MKEADKYREIIFSIKEGDRTNFDGLQLRDINLSNMKLRDLSFKGADLREANLVGTKIKNVNFHGANLENADFLLSDIHDTSFYYAELSGINFCGSLLVNTRLASASIKNAHFNEAYISNSDLTYSNMQNSDMRNAKINSSDLRFSNFRGVNFRNAMIENTHFYGATLTKARGLLVPSEWMEKNFKKSKDGYIVYKRIGISTPYPGYWKGIEEGKILTETCNPDRTDENASGVNFGTFEWCSQHYKGSDLWECLIKWEWLPDVVVPYSVCSHARCEKLQLMKRIQRGESVE